MSHSISVLINSYNYGRFVVEAVESALAQTLAPRQVIVVDDGSTDGTEEILRTRFGRDARVKIVRQANAGQLSAVVAGFEHADGDLIFCLDADDRYEPAHLESVVATYDARPEIDFVFTACREFGSGGEIIRIAPADRHFGLSVARTLTRLSWIGSVTSTLSMRASVMRALLPCLRLVAPRWKIRADDCLVLGASLVGCQKFALAAPTVGYRVHGGNSFHHRTPQLSENYAHWLRRKSFISVIALQMGIGADSALRAESEFRCLPDPGRADYEEYCLIVRQLPLPFLDRLKMRLRMARHYRRARNAGAASRPPSR